MMKKQFVLIVLALFSYVGLSAQSSQRAEKEAKVQKIAAAHGKDVKNATDAELDAMISKLQTNAKKNAQVKSTAPRTIKRTSSTPAVTKKAASPSLQQLKTLAAKEKNPAVKAKYQAKISKLENK